MKIALSELPILLNQFPLHSSDLLKLIEVQDEQGNHLIQEFAYQVKMKTVGPRVHFRGIIEFSNICIKNCYYCGIRRDHKQVNRFQMATEEILKSAVWAYENDYGSIVLQAGERQDPVFIHWVEEIIREIHLHTHQALGITLSLGEQSPETYQKWFQAGAQRYLLRIETSRESLYQELHPEHHSFQNRLECLTHLRTIGYQVGTGVMIGLPGQTHQDLVNDLLFFRDYDIDMIGMGPYVIHQSTPLGQQAVNTEEKKKERFQLGLRMIALARILLPTVNIAATTALQALHPVGREMGLKSGANILMPIITDSRYRKDYLLYDGKPCVEDSAGQCKRCLESRIHQMGETIGYQERGDSIRFNQRNETKIPSPSSSLKPSRIL